MTRAAISFVITASTAMSLSACNTWQPAEHSVPTTLTAAPLTVTAADTEWPDAAWWQKYHDTVLNQLIEQALQGSPTLAQAEARFNQARESVRVAAAASGLQVGASASIARNRLSDNGLLPAQYLGFNWYTQADLGLQASYSFDWWHKRRDTTEAALDSARAAQAEQAAATLALSGAVAQSYFGWQADQTQIASLDAQLQLLVRQQAITQARIDAQLETADGVQQLLAAQAALKEARTALDYSAQLRRITLAALLGVNVTQLATFTASPLPTVTAQVPANSGIDLLARRADITAARWRIEAAEHQLSAARAEFLPDISLNALAALSSIDLGKLLNAGSAAPSLGAAVHLPIFDSGLLTAQYGARAAQLDAAVASYNDTVISAARDVATQMLQLERLGAQRELRTQQADAVARLLDNARARQQHGLTDLRPVLSAEQDLLQQQAALTALDADAVNADVQLQLALGGGYQAANNASL